MENPASPDEGLFVRIRQELDKLPLSDGQKEKVLPSLLKRARFLDARNGKRTAGRLRGHSGYSDFAAKIKAVVSRFARRTPIAFQVLDLSALAAGRHPWKSLCDAFSSVTVR
jgi:hypothetical protein